MGVMNKKIGAVILAAGVSSRLGEPKQLLRFRGQTLIARVIQTALAVNFENLCVILGAKAELIEKECQNLPVSICHNSNWQRGMSSSIKCGLGHLLAQTSDLDAVMILLCDQPLIKSAHLQKLINKFETTKKPIIAACYQNIVGVPALFSKDIFSELLSLEGERGAGKIININPERVEHIEIPEAGFDIDTQADFTRLENIG